ncbi:MAG: fructose-6-phosphate aldolase, partial [Deltaproteobacteria bacterium]|nr:fructose-6-phosphate aldolase [Deltaproteobacteria bacterium]
ASWGILDGVTTNPSLIAKTGRDFKGVIQEICEIVNGPISAECVETEAAKMIPEARTIAKLHPNVVVKVPLTTEGLKTVKVVSADGIKTNVTLCFSPAQGLLAAKAGATYISPFVGRLDDVAHEGMDVVRDLVTIYKTYGYPTQVLAARIRHPRHVIEAALAGSHVATIPFNVLSQLVKHPLTDSGLAKFLADWQKVPKK